MSASIFLCDPEDVGYPTCWYCEAMVPSHASDRRFCSHECAADHAAEIGGGPCTVCGKYPRDHSTEHTYFPFGADPDEVYAALTAEVTP